MDLTQILPQFGNVAFTLAAFVVALSVIVAIHEYGHYIVGRWSGIHAEVFSLGFGPVLVSRRNKHGTLWQIAALPFGGYVKFLGDANAASVGQAAGTDPAKLRHTMLGAPLWARAATVAAGPIFNFILSILIFAAVILTQGRAADPLTIERMLPLPATYVNELRAGDEILAIGGSELPGEDGLARLAEGYPAEPVLDYRVRRDGREMLVRGPYPQPPLVGGVSPRSAADAAGLRAGDVILELEGSKVFAFAQLIEIVTASEGRTLDLTIWRNGETRELSLTPRRVDLPRPEGGFETRWLLGISSGLFFEAATETPSLGTALGDAVAQVWNIIVSSLSGLGHMITGAISSCNLSGPVGIAQASGAMAEQGATSFIWFVAVLSTAVGLLNLFPIPVLDGGHLVFFGYEAITGRQPGDKALRVLMALGLSLILTMTVFAVLNDLFLCP
ncbi:RIP metalloprotease RseP [Limimaricola soesokkakensis]|uniref:RIP metalloprotease RseP n=1 Tax=Limimaricola soesokkakensis TaxID=1343159 RepID=UPI0035158093